MRLHIQILICCFVFLGSCKTMEEPLNYIGSAEFYAAGKIDNTPLLVEAGNKNFVMQTDNGADSLGINYFKSTLFQNCVNCNEKLSVTIRNYEIGNSPSWQADSTFKTNFFYNYFKDILPPSGFKVIFNNQSVGTGNVDYKWDFGAGFGNLSASPEFTFKSEGRKDIVLTANYKDMGCVSNIENPIYINPSNLNGYIDFNYTNIGSNVFRCTVINADSTTHRFVWQYLNATTSFPIGKVFELPAFSVEGAYKVDLLAINKITGDTTMVTKNLVTSANTNCSANFTYSIQPIRDTLQLNKVIVDYTSPSGVLYSSRSIEQFTSFSIIEISNYKNIIKDKKTIKVKVKFSCKVSDGINIKELKDIEAILAFSY